MKLQAKTFDGNNIFIEILNDNSYTTIQAEARPFGMPFKEDIAKIKSEHELIEVVKSLNIECRSNIVSVKNAYHVQKWESLFFDQNILPTLDLRWMRLEFLSDLRNRRMLFDGFSTCFLNFVVYVLRFDIIKYKVSSDLNPLFDFGGTLH